MSAPSTAKAIKANLVEICRTLWPDPVKVVYGPVGSDDPDDIVEILAVSFTEGKARQSPLRKRWYSFAVTGRITTFQGGGEEIQQTVTERGLDMLAELADYLQDSGTVPSTQINLGNVVQWARLSFGEAVEEEEDIEDGRKTVIDFLVTGEFVA